MGVKKGIESIFVNGVKTKVKIFRIDISSVLEPFSEAVVKNFNERLEIR